MAFRTGKTEHAGPKNSGRKHGFFGRRYEAKKWARKTRRRNDRIAAGRQS